MKEYIIEDQIHCEYIGKYTTLEDATKELKRLSELKWNEDKNKAPCMLSETCGREYALIEYDTLGDKWTELHREAIFDISSAGIVFHKNPYI